MIDEELEAITLNHIQKHVWFFEPKKSFTDISDVTEWNVAEWLASTYNTTDELPAVTNWIRSLVEE